MRTLNLLKDSNCFKFAFPTFRIGMAAMKPTFLLLFILFASLCSKAQPVIQWQKSLGGIYDDAAYSIQQTVDGGYIVAGSFYYDLLDMPDHHGAEDYWVVKLDGSGEIQWQKFLGGNDFDFASSIQQTSDGGYIVAGGAKSYDGDVTGHHETGDDGYDYWVVKLDGSGNIQWQKALGGDGLDAAYSIQQTTDGGYIVGGYSSSDNGDVSVVIGIADYWVVKLDGSGNIQWQKSLNKYSDDEAFSIQQTTDGGYIVGGASSAGYNAAVSSWVVKLDTLGNIQWQKLLLGTIARSVQQTADGGYIVAGSSGPYNPDVTGHGEADYWVVKLDGSGNIQWQKSLGGTASDAASSIKQTADGGYIVAGTSRSNDGDVSGNHGTKDYWIVKLDSFGNIQWQKSLGGTGFDLGTSIQQTSDNGYIVAGYSLSNDGDISGYHGGEGSDGWIVKLAPYGVSVTGLNFDGLLQNDAAILNWSTATERNNKGFEVQKSMDNKTFTPIGFVNTHGNSQQITKYIFSDHKLLSGSNYYRLKQMDSVGNFSYSSVIKLDFSRFEWVIIGNTVSNNSRVQLQLDKPSKVMIQVISIDGTIIQTINKGKISQGTYSIPLNLSNTNSGIYILKLMVDDKTYSKKIVK